MSSYWPLVETVWDSISIYDGPEQFESQFNGAPLVARTLFAAHWCLSEVENGGLQQFFWNGTGVLAPEAAAAFDALGMPRTAQVLREAMAWFGKTFPREREPRMESLDLYEENNPDDPSPFSSLDDKVWELLESENGGFIAAADQYSSRRDA